MAMEIEARPVHSSRSLSLVPAHRQLCLPLLRSMKGLRVPMVQFATFYRAATVSVLRLFA